MKWFGGNDNNKKSIFWFRITWGVIAIAFALVWWGVFDPQPNDVVWQVDYRGDWGCGNENRPWEIAQTATVLLTFPTHEQVQVSLNDHFVLAILPAGFVSLEAGGEFLRPLAPFPHVRVPPEASGNDVWIDMVDAAAVSIRLNGELYWQGAVPLVEEASLSVVCFSPD